MSQSHIQPSFCRAVLLTLTAGLALGACDTPPPTASAPDHEPQFAAGQAGGVIPGRFIVVVRGAAAPAAVAAEHGIQPDFVYQHALHGFAGQIADAARSGLMRDARVMLIEPDRVVEAWGTQTNATWGLDRIDQRNLPLNSTYNYNATGTGVRAYIIDTGIRLAHNDFGGRAVTGFDAITSGGSANDCNGHGTHVAGTVGGSTWGVAKNVRLVAVRVLDCNGSGTTSGVIAGVDWVAANHVKPAVANMSLGGGASSTLDNAVNNAINAGVTFVVAAGNGDFIGRAQNACNYSPARVPAALTIGATNSSDTKASWSNYGSCVDFFAPGVGITSAWHSSNTATNTISGTSMAAPHVAGVAALYLETNTGAAPSAVGNALYNATTKNIVTSSNTTNNHLLYSLFGAPPANVAPTAAFTFSCSGLTCSFTDGSSDSDGSVVGWSWNFGDGGTSSAQNPTRNYASGGTYTVTLMVTDNGGLTGTTSKSVSVSAPSGGITLTATGTKVKGEKFASLTWSGTAAGSIDVFRDDGHVDTVANTGSYTDSAGKGGGSHAYRVCNAGTSTCSNTVTVSF